MKKMKLVYEPAEHIKLELEDVTLPTPNGMSGMIYSMRREVKISITVGNQVHSVVVPTEALISGLKAL
jgi:hypothetical protein